MVFSLDLIPERADERARERAKQRKMLSAEKIDFASADMMLHTNI